ncbi:MAG: PilZ domain-containing protein [Candidatus Omnitrophota bacterium]|jgi:hypothetical protein
MNRPSVEEKRLYSRIKTNLRVSVSDDFSGDLIDLSEGGLSFGSIETISSPVISLQISFPDKKFELKTKAKLLWKRNLEKGGSLYGVEFTGLDRPQKAALRKELIKAQISGLINDIKIPEIKKLVSHFFLEDMLHYITEIINITAQLIKMDKYSLELEKDLDRLNNEILLKGYCLEELLSDKSIMQRVKENFRQLVGAWVYKSIIVKRAFEKPRGYPGDYKMLEIVYDNKPISNNLGKYSDNNFLKSPYAVAVRIRKDRLKEMLLNFINQTNLSKIKILNIACGSCREIRELLPDLKTRTTATFTCLDWDEEALRFSQDRLLSIMPKNVQFKFVKDDVMNIIKNKASAELSGKQNLIYSIGLIDYLPDRVLKKLIQALFQLLDKRGRLILTHKNKEKTFPSIPPDWFCDWKFISRNKDEVVKLFYDCGISEFSLLTESDDFGYIHYFTLVRK